MRRTSGRKTPEGRESERCAKLYSQSPVQYGWIRPAPAQSDYFCRTPGWGHRLNRVVWQGLASQSVRRLWFTRSGLWCFTCSCPAWLRPAPSRSDYFCPTPGWWDGRIRRRGSGCGKPYKNHRPCDGSEALIRL